MNINLMSKFVIIIAASLLITANAFAQSTLIKSNTKTADTSTTAWTSHKICEDTVRVAFPAAPIEKVDLIDLGGGSILTTRVNIASSAQAVYMATCFDGLPIIAEKMSPEMKKVFFDTSMKGFAKEMNAQMSALGFTFSVKLFPAREKVFSGQPAYEQDFTIGQMKGRARMILYGQSGVWLLAMTSNEETAKEAVNFFGSLKIPLNEALLIKLPSEEM